MRRGRPPIRSQVQELIFEILSSISTPMSINAICEEIFNQTKKRISWNTVQKYLKELIEADQITAIQLPHSKSEKKFGLCVYTLKK